MVGNILRLTKFKQLNERSKVVAKNALISLCVKGFTILLGFAYVPLFLSTVGQRKYGILLTIISLSSFVSFFDVGIGKGLRIHLGRAIADNNRDLSKQYVSTSYFYITLLFIGFFLIYLCVSPWVDFYKVFNVSNNEVDHLNTTMMVVIASFAVNFILSLLGTIMQADQKSSTNDFLNFLSNFSSLLLCLVLKWLHLLHFNNLILIMLLLPVFMQLMYSIIYFSTSYKWLRPSLSHVKHSIRKDLLNLGFKYFLIQIVAITIFSTTNILIAQLFNVEDVATYNIGYKYYNVTVMVFSILMSPLWGAFTQAWHQGDIKWISKNLKFYTLLVVALVVVNLAQVFIFPYFIHLWLKRDIAIPGVLAASYIIYNFIFCYNDIFAHFLAGVGKVDRQLYSAIAGGVLNIPVTIYLAKHTDLGLSSILLANVICLLPSSIVTTIHTIQLLRSKKTHIQKV
jgi:O-antigen/teichoic acid export membrane protein